MRAAQELAASLIGLNGREAKGLAVLEGYHRSQVITPDVGALTLDLIPDPAAVERMEHFDVGAARLEDFLREGELGPYKKGAS